VSESLIATARRLVRPETGRPRHSDLQRAVSTAYDALFRVLAEEGANLLVGMGASRPDAAWNQVYRALDHGDAKSACRELRKLRFPNEIQQFADTFVRLQEARHSADYDPEFRIGLSEAKDWIALAEQQIYTLRAASRRDRVAFVVLMLFNRRP
jgi:hypothetical protein